MTPLDILPWEDMGRYEIRYPTKYITSFRGVVINLIIKARVRVLLLNVSSNFDNFFIDIREANILKIKDYNLIEILI